MFWEDKITQIDSYLDSLIELRSEYQRNELQAE